MHRYAHQGNHELLQVETLCYCARQERNAPARETGSRECQVNKCYRVLQDYTHRMLFKHRNRY